MGESRLPLSDRGDITYHGFQSESFGCIMMNMLQAEQIEAVPQIARIPGAEERSVTLDGVTWRYWFAGSGPPLLLIHGFLGYSFSWRFNMEPLSQAFFRLRHGFAGLRFLAAPGQAGVHAGWRCRRSSALHATLRHRERRYCRLFARRRTHHRTGCVGFAD